MKEIIADNFAGAQKTTLIKNRDIPVLSRVIYAMQDARMIERRIDWQEDQLGNITVNMSGMPRGSGPASGFDATYAALDYLCEQHKEQLSMYMRELKEAEKIINAIQNPKMRTFVVMMYVEELPKAVVRRELNMTEYAFNKAKHAIEQAESMSAVVWRERYITER